MRCTLPSKNKITPYIQRKISLLSKDEAQVWQRQFLFSQEENHPYKDFILDPLHEEEISPLPRLFHKYTQKVLIHCTDTCPVYCRFCTRKRYTEKKSKCISSAQIESITAYLQNHPHVQEVIFSGGEVFSLREKKIAQMLNAFSVVPTIKKFRFHTRLPIVQPQAFVKKIPFLVELQENFLNKKNTAREKNYFTLVVHINHAIEISDEFLHAIEKLKQANFILKSQSVLLKGINDTEDVLHNLFEKITQAGLHPYYLHHLDKVQGAAHFFVSYQQGLALMQNLENRTDKKYNLPRYVIDSKEGKKEVKDWL